MRLIPCTELREHSLWLDRRGQKELLCELNQKGYPFPVTTGSAHTGLLGLLVCETCMLMCVCVCVCVVVWGCVCVCVCICVVVCVCGCGVCVCVCVFVCVLDGVSVLLFAYQLTVVIGMPF